MPNKGAPFRTSHSKIAFSGSGGKESNTLLTKYSSSKKSPLERVISNSQKSINKKLDAKTRIALKYIHPGAYYGLLTAEMLYKHRNIIFKTIDKVIQIWSEDTTISGKIVETAEEILKTGAKVTKNELKARLIGYVSSEFSEAVVDKLEDNKIVNTVSNEVILKNHKERFKSLLKDTIEKQTASSLESIMEYT